MTPRELIHEIMPPDRRWFGLILVFSFLLHGLLFGFIQLELVQPSGVPLRPRQASMLLPGSAADGGNPMIWLEWRDPGAVAFPRSPLPELQVPQQLPAPMALPDLAPRPAPAAPELTRDLPGDLAQRVRQQIPAGAMPVRQPVPLESPPPLGGTTHRITGSLAARPIEISSELPQPRTDLSLRATVLALGVNTDGMVEHLMVEESSGEPTVDAAAIQNIRGWRFRALEEGGDIQWGRIIVFWDLKEKPPAERRTP